MSYHLGGFLGLICKTELQISIMFMQRLYSADSILILCEKYYEKAEKNWTEKKCLNKFYRNVPAAHLASSRDRDARCGFLWRSCLLAQALGCGFFQPVRLAGGWFVLREKYCWLTGCLLVDGLGFPILVLVDATCVTRESRMVVALARSSGAFWFGGSWNWKQKTQTCKSF
jgi:hypothetical protein